MFVFILSLVIEEKYIRQMVDKIALIFIFMQKYIVSGLTNGAVKA